MIFILVAHVVGAGIIIGGIILSIFFLSTKKVTNTIISTVASFGEVMKYAALAQLITGSILYMNEPDKFRGNKFLWAKLILYVISGILGGAIIQKQMKKLQKEENPDARRLQKLFYVHLLVILFIVTNGVFLAESE